ncbi:interleukin-20 receptor subunit alpha-like [Narcine bancroftii]|uniref:interleukin-20 receptor subunit alpha-like n=1 Tax=Narcine bancroftii TaxID=1343680 RepID=UPI003831A315
MWPKGLFPVVLLVLLAESGNSKGSKIPAPRNVHFLSQNLRNVLHWELPVRRGSGKLFSVEYKVYGERDWKIKSECQDITQQQCDLSNETDEYKEHYYARVRTASEAGFSNWSKSARFNPEMETNFTSPNIKLELGVSSITIKLTAPKKWQDNHHAQSISLTKIFQDLKFEVLVINKNTNKSCTFVKNEEIIKVDTVEYDTTYCVTAWSVERSSFRKSDPSAIQCTTIPEDPTKQLVKMILLGCVLPIFILIFLFTLMCCFMYKYVNVNDQKQPTNLLPQDCSSKKTFLFFSPESLTVNVMVLENPGGKPPLQCCIHADECKIPLRSQVSNECANEWKVIPLEPDNEKYVYKCQTVRSPSEESHVCDKENGLTTADQSKQRGPSNEKEMLKAIQSGDLATESISCPQQLQSIQLPNGNHSEPPRSGYKSQLPSRPLISEEAQRRVEYGLLTIDTCLDPKYEQPHHLSNAKAEDPQQSSYLQQSPTNDLNTRTSGSDADWAIVGSHDAQHGRVYLPKVPLEQEQNNHKSQFQPLPPAGKPPRDYVDHCSILLDTNVQNEIHYNVMEEPDLTILDWDLSSPRLSLSAVCVRRDSENSGSLSQSFEPQNDLLSSVCSKTFPDDSLKTDEDAYLSNFQEQWGLSIQL